MRTKRRSSLIDCGHAFVGEDSDLSASCHEVLEMYTTSVSALKLFILCYHSLSSLVMPLNQVTEDVDGNAHLGYIDEKCILLLESEL